MFIEKDFSEKVKALRKIHGLSQEEFGRRIGVAKSTICHYERGTNMPTLDTLGRMAFEFKTPASYFLPGELSVKKPQGLYGTHIPLYDNKDLDSIAEGHDINVFRSISLLIPDAYSSDDCIATTSPDNSMNKTGIRKGAVVVIDRDAPILDGTIIAAIYRDTLTFRRYHENAYGKYISTESTRTPASLSREEIPKHNFRIVGRIIQVVLDTKYM